MTKVEGWEVLTFNQKILSMLSLHHTYLSLSNLVLVRRVCGLSVAN